jgi:signal transduction histidine kinase
MATEMRKTGIDVVGDVAAWGAHFCLFYETKQDLLDTLISYCKSGLESEEYCLWIVAEPLRVGEATDALKDAVPALDRYLADSRLEIASARDFFLRNGEFDGKRLTAAWYEKLADVSARGYLGMRVTGDTTWLSKKDWGHFCDYEDGLNEVIGNQRLAVLCTYPLAGCGAPQILDVVRTHQFVLARRYGSWDVVETAALKRAKAEIARLNKELEQRVVERTNQLVRASEALREAQAELARVTRVTTMGEVTASIAHELKQPIAAAITNSNTCRRWLSREPPDLDEAREAASRMVKDATSAADIIERIRSMFKKGTPQREPVAVNEVIQDVIVLLRNEADRYSVSIHADLGRDFPRVMADRVQLQQVLTNLMLNGIEAMKDVDAARELTVKSEQAGNSDLLISVSDTGVGLVPGQAEQIFKAFFTTKPDGTGMGLPISRSIIESHRGRLWATAKQPRGAVFQFTLPTEDDRIPS